MSKEGDVAVAPDAAPAEEEPPDLVEYRELLRMMLSRTMARLRRLRERTPGRVLVERAELLRHLRLLRAHLVTARE